MRSRAASLLLVLAVLCCGSCRGETVYLGDDPGEDGEQPDGDPCSQRSDCEDAERPWCNPSTERCVECVYDWQCLSGFCRNKLRDGECARS
jgi:hypothetical protein